MSAFNISNFYFCKANLSIFFFFFIKPHFFQKKTFLTARKKSSMQPNFADNLIILHGNNNKSMTNKIIN